MRLIDRLLNNKKKDVNFSNLVPIAGLSSDLNKDHDDIHSLYRMRKSLVYLIGEDNLKGLSAEDLETLHENIVEEMTNNNINHYYSYWDGELDEKLPPVLYSKTTDTPRKIGKGIFNLEDQEVEDDIEMTDSEDEEYGKMLDELGIIDLWEAPKKRAEVPADHFIDQKNKKYPYKNADGTINCAGLKAAISYAGGARGAPKRPQIKAKAQKIYDKNCKTKEASEPKLVGKISKF